MTGFVLLRVRAHRLLLAAALLAVLLTTSVLATLAAFSGAIGDAALQAGLRGRSAAAASVLVSGQVPAARRAAAEEAVREGMRKTFDGLPVTLRRLERSGPYALPRSLQPPAARAGDPDLTHFAAVDRSRLSLVRGAWPAAAAPAGVVETALPEEAARRLDLAPGAVLDLTDRLDNRKVRARVTGVYRPVDTGDLYWRLDPAGGRGVRTVAFTTYGPLLVDPAVIRSGALTTGETAWLGSADFTGLTTDRIDALRTASTEGPKALAADTAPFGTTVAVSTALPTVLEQTQRALLVSRSTLLIVAVQLILLAAYALLLVARLLSTERSGETALLRARGGSRRRIAGLAAAEALLLALPAALAAPLLSGPLTGLFAERSALSALGVRLDTTPSLQVWLVAAAVALCCAAAVVAPALAAGDGAAVSLRKARSAALPGPVRAGADLGLLAVAAVAYWQLQRPSAAGGTLGTDGPGGGSVDPVLVAAPALALLAGTVLTLRLLPPAAKLAERRAAGGRGLSAALAGWQFSRRPLRGAGPVLLLVLAVAMGMLAIGQSGSWERSQRDQADFRVGAAVRVLGAGPGEPTQTEQLGAVPGVRSAAPVHRGTMDVAGKNATVLAVDTRNAAGGLLLRPDLADVPVHSLLAPLAPAAVTRPGLPLPAGTRTLSADLRLAEPKVAARVTAVLEDPNGVPYRRAVGPLPGDGRTHRLSLDVGALAAAPGAGADRGSAGLLTLTGLEFAGEVVDGAKGTQTLQVERFGVTGADGGETVHSPATVLGSWTHSFEQTAQGDAQRPVPTSGVPGAAGPGGRPAPYVLTFAVSGAPVGEVFWGPEQFAVRMKAPGPQPPSRLSAVATRTFMTASGAAPGDRVEVPLGGRSVDVTVDRVVDELPTTGPGAAAAAAGGSATTPEDGGAILLDLASVNRFLSTDEASTVPATEWWLTVAPGRAGEVAAALRARPNADPAQVLVRDEVAAELLGDPLGAGPNAALMAVAAAAAALAAVGFAVGSAGALRERSAEFGVLRALGAPRRRLARLVAAEQGLLIGIGLLVGIGLGTVLARAVVPLVVLTGQAARPVPPVLVELPLGQVALLLAGVAVLPLAVVAAIALRRTDPAVTLRHQAVS
ncbi:ABC transporter permease [Streptomyces sp. adm13(2018)]|uniref:ABC transporter permease n=1 Tax=Streptomyces sp. adm13(2018) TaxID=2479007 RepID=UPI0011CEC585|nr:ABC transporter permease [Streptomyces sp. adm13(2018)]TXS13738.1 ABC transporter permease [Streptomyces sp. adm13(2018)]